MTPEQMLTIKGLLDALLFAGAIVGLLAIWRRIRIEYKDLDDDRQ